MKAIPLRQTPLGQTTGKPFTDISRTGNSLTDNVLQKAVFCSAKDGLSCCKTWPFALRKATFQKTPDVRRPPNTPPAE